MPIPLTLESDKRERSLVALPVVGDLCELEPARSTIHIIDSHATGRASAFRIFSKLGYHCEIYSNLGELIAFQPTSGIVLVHEHQDGVTSAMVLEATREAGLALTVVGCSHNPTINQVIDAMRAGAKHFFALPFAPDVVEPVLKSLAMINVAEQRSNELRAQALVKLRRLSVRERQVLEHMVEGNSNKSIARLLDISPRTVEIHRMKAMGKIGAQNVSEAVRIWLIGSNDFNR